MKSLTSAQERALRMIFDGNPELCRWSDVLLPNGEGRNPTFRILTSLGFIEYSQIAGNSFRAALTVKGIHYLHGE